MVTKRFALCALTVVAAGALSACGVGDYHIPPVAPVVEADPNEEDDIFGDLDLDLDLDGDGDGDDGAESNGEKGSWSGDDQKADSAGADEPKGSEEAKKEAPAPKETKPAPKETKPAPDSSAPAAK